MENILALIQTWLGGGSNNSILMVVIAVGVVLFITSQKKPKPADVAALGHKSEGLADALQVFRASHEAAAGDFAAIDPNAIVNLFNTLAKFYPLLRMFAKLFGLDLPDITVTPLPPANQAKKPQ